MEGAIVQQSRPFMTAGMALSVCQNEWGKGCQPHLAPYPVWPRPRFRALSSTMVQEDKEKPLDYVPLPLPGPGSMQRFTIWLTPDFECNWLAAERFLRQLYTCSKWLAFEILGNERSVALRFLCHEDDALKLQAAFVGEYESCRLEPGTASPLDALPMEAWRSCSLREYFPAEPYSDLFTRPNALGKSPLSPLMNVLAVLPSSCIGIYQVIFSPTLRENNWHRNIEILHDAIYLERSYEGTGSGQRYAQQVPSTDLRGTALDTDQKSHNDKPIFAAIARVALLSATPAAPALDVASMAVFMSLFQHGGHPLEFIDENAFGKVLSPEQLRAMFVDGLSYRPGFILNSEELAGFAHLVLAPPSVIKRSPHGVLDGLGPTSPGLQQGTLIGHRRVASQSVAIHLPADWHSRHGHVIGMPGHGKSFLIETMILQDIAQRYGVAVLDPHGDLAERLLGLLPEEAIDRVVYLDPGDPEWIPLWNLLSISSEQDPSRVADELVAIFRKFSDGWGDRLAHLLRQILSGLLLLGDVSLLDVAAVLGGKSAKRERIVGRVVAAARNPATAHFWKYDLAGYSKTEIHPVINKIGKLLAQDSVARMFSQPRNVFDFRRFMDEGRIFIANLARVGPEIRDTLGSFIMTFIYLAALSRCDIPVPSRKPFFVYADEAHRFMAGPITNCIAETRKHSVSNCVIHQYLSQFKTEEIDSLAATGYTAVFKVLKKDAEKLVRTIGGDINPDDLTTLAPREAIVRIGPEWVKITTVEQPAEVNAQIREKAVALSRSRYCIHVDPAIPWTASRSQSVLRPGTACPIENESEEDYFYEEFMPEQRD